MSAGGRAPASSEQGPAGPLAVVLSCPQCGGPSVIDDDTVSLTCAHCRSFLIVARPGREEFFLAQSQVDGPDAIRSIVVLYRTQAHRAELVARFGTEGSDGERVPPSEALIERLLREFEERLLSQMQVLETHRIQVPYWHVTGSILQAILGRRRDGPKRMLLRAFGAEHSVPGYDTTRANLRDLWLRMSRARVKPLARKEVAAEGPFLPWLSIPEQSYREILKWANRDLVPDFEAVTRRAAFAFAKRLLVYRSYWLALVTTDQDTGWILVDSGFGTIAGHPSEDEVRGLLRLAVADPEGSASRETRAVVRAARCPDCGADQAFDRRWRVAMCPNCHLALAPEEAGLKVVPYDHAVRGQADLDGFYLPFWVFEFSLTLPGGKAVTRLEEHARTLFPQGVPQGFSPQGTRLFVPAFRLLGTEVGDQAFQDLVAATHGAPPDVRDGKIPLGGRPSCEAVTVPESEAREALPWVLLCLHNKPSAARLNTRLIQKVLGEARLDAGPGRLLMVAFEREGGDVAIPGTDLVIPGLVLRGGPELEAHRATVYQPQPKRVAT